MQLEEVGKPTKRTSEWDNKRTKPVRTSIKTDQLEASRKRPRGEEDDLNSQDDSKRMIHRMTQFPDHTLWVPAQRWSAVERTIERSFVWSTEWPFGQFKWRTENDRIFSTFDLLIEHRTTWKELATAYGRAWYWPIDGAHRIISPNYNRTDNEYCSWSATDNRRSSRGRNRVKEE